MVTNQIKEIENVNHFFSELNTKFGLNWHPDDEFNEDKLSTIMNECFNYCENNKIDIYSIAFDSTKNIRSQFGIGIEK